MNINGEYLQLEYPLVTSHS